VCSAFCCQSIRCILTLAPQFDNPILKPACLATAPSDDGSGINGGVAAASRQRIEIASPLDSDSLNMSSKNGRGSARDCLVHLPFKPRRRAVEASQVCARGVWLCCCGCSQIALMSHMHIYVIIWSANRNLLQPIIRLNYI